MSTGTLLFSGTDLASLCIVEDLSDFWSSSEPRGDQPVYPGISGSLALQMPTSSKIASGQVTVTADTLADTEDAVAGVKALLAAGIPQTVTRRKITGTGNLDATQTGIARSVEERWQGPGACTLLIAVELTDGKWYGASLNIASAAGTQAIAGDVRTTRMTLTLAAGAARTVANTTNGHQFTFGATVPTGGVLVDVEARTATAITGGTDMSASLSWPKVHPFRLDPGANVITVSAGSASIDYQPAYQ
jgi:hypothetical protein